MEKFIRVMFYSILSIFGGLLGYQIGQYVQKTAGVRDTPLNSTVNIWAIVIVCVLIGIAVAPVVTTMFLRLIDMVISGLKKISFQEIILGSIGLIFGLLVATLINLVLGFIPFERIAVVGEFIKPFLYFVIAVFWGYLGIFFATRMVFMQNINQFFSKSINSKTQGLTWGKNSKILDTSVIVDGRIYEICKSGFLEGPLIVPRFVLNELQLIADSADFLKRNRGRRGLDVLHNLQNNPGIEIRDKDYEEIGVDRKLVKFSQEMGGDLLTTDYNLNKVAQLQGIKVLNINELANALKPVVLPGEELEVSIIKEGKESGQGVGYLDDGTMIVVEDGRKYLGEDIKVEVTSVIQTMAGKMIFGRSKKNIKEREKR